uniref:Uncharacterized protein n=1 Tax=Arundo donax TaxID=35708 RepID=A0A0A9FIA7_ARUDO
MHFHLPSTQHTYLIWKTNITIIINLLRATTDAQQVFCKPRVALCPHVVYQL